MVVALHPLVVVLTEQRDQTLLGPALAASAWASMGVRHPAQLGSEGGPVGPDAHAELDGVGEFWSLVTCLYFSPVPVTYC